MSEDDKDERFYRDTEAIASPKLDDWQLALVEPLAFQILIRVVTVEDTAHVLNDHRSVPLCFGTTPRSLLYIHSRSKTRTLGLRPLAG
jgi:hypothetical protein